MPREEPPLHVPVQHSRRGLGAVRALVRCPPLPRPFGRGLPQCKYVQVGAGRAGVSASFRDPGPGCLRLAGFRRDVHLRPRRVLRPGCLAKEDPGRPGAQAMAAYFLDSSRAVYETFVTIGAGSPSATPCLFTARMDLEPSMEAQYLRWQEREVFPELVGGSRVRRRPDRAARRQLRAGRAACARRRGAEPTLSCGRSRAPTFTGKTTPGSPPLEARPEGSTHAARSPSET